MIARMEYEQAAMDPTTDCGGNSEPRSYGERGGAFFQASPACNNAVGGASSGYPVLQEPPGPDGIDEPASGNPCGGAPTTAVVDPVSLMLAQAEANRCRGNGVREDRLAFGPIVVPKDAFPPPAEVPDINEEGLYALEKAIVELKTCKRFGQSSAALATDTDALLALEEDAQPIDVDAAGPEVNLPSYADVGYQTETPYCAPLIAGVAVPPIAVTCSNSAGEYSPPQQCNKMSQCKCSCGKCNKKSPSWQCSCGKYMK